MLTEDLLGGIRKNSEPAYLKEFRIESFKKFENSKPETTDLFKYQTFFNDFDLNNYQFDISADAGYDFGLARDVLFAVQTGPDKIKINLPENLRNKGVVISTLDNSIKNEMQFKQILVSNSKIDDKFSHMNNALFSSGLYVYVPKGLEIGQPFRLMTLVNSNMINKIIFILDYNSKLRVIKEDYSTDASNSIVYSDSVEVLLKDGAEFHLSHIQNVGKNVIHFSNKTGTCNKGSRLYWNLGYFGGKKVRSKVYSLLLGEGSEAEDLEVLFGSKEQQFDMFSNLIHTGKNTNGRVVSNGVLRDKSNSIFKGMIKITEFAKYCNSFLAEHAMLLSEDARAKAIQGLEIETNEVKATHSASVSQIEDDKIFYLMSRGLSEEESKKMIAFGFFEPVIQKMFLEEMRIKISHLLELKWQGREEDFIKDLSKLKSQEAAETKEKKDIFEGHYKYR